MPSQSNIIKVLIAAVFMVGMPALAQNNAGALIGKRLPMQPPATSTQNDMLKNMRQMQQSMIQMRSNARDVRSAPVYILPNTVSNNTLSSNTSPTSTTPRAADSKARSSTTTQSTPPQSVQAPSSLNLDSAILGPLITMMLGTQSGAALNGGIDLDGGLGGNTLLPTQ